MLNQKKGYTMKKLSIILLLSNLIINSSTLAGDVIKEPITVNFHDEKTMNIPKSIAKRLNINEGDVLRRTLPKEDLEFIVEYMQEDPKEIDFSTYSYEDIVFLFKTIQIQKVSYKDENLIYLLIELFNKNRKHEFQDIYQSRQIPSLALFKTTLKTMIINDLLNKSDLSTHPTKKTVLLVTNHSDELQEAYNMSISGLEKYLSVSILDLIDANFNFSNQFELREENELSLAGLLLSSLDNIENISSIPFNNVKELDLSNNRLQQLNDYDFSSFPNVEKIYLDNNPLKTFFASNFEYLKKLTEISVRNPDFASKRHEKLFKERLQELQEELPTVKIKF